ncbi:MAG TPA: ATP synthase F1 subunit gamma [Polyangiaceae bacterium]
MANLKIIRKRISIVKSTQKITRAMKMVAAARLNRAQQRINAMRPHAIKIGRMLADVTAAAAERAGTDGEAEHPLLARREEKNVLLVVVTSDRGQCGAFNSNINRFAERRWKDLSAEGKSVKMAVVGRKGRDYQTRRHAPIWHLFTNVWDKLGPDKAELLAAKLLQPFAQGSVDSIYLVYNEFKSAMTQKVVCERLFPLMLTEPSTQAALDASETVAEFDFEPSKDAVLEQLVPTYVEITILRALYESMASELGARMTAMDSATKNAGEVIDRLTLQYNRARQAAITTELMEIIGGANALQE